MGGVGTFTHVVLNICRTWMFIAFALLPIFLADPALPHTDIPKKGNHDKSESCAGLVWVESLPGGMYSSNDLLVSTALQCSGCVL